MNVDFVIRSLRTATWVTIIFAPCIAMHSMLWAAGFMFASLWSVGNVWAIARLTTMLLTPDLDSGALTKALPWIFIKFPVLYGAGILVVIYSGFPASSMLTGFHVIFVVFVLKAVALSMGWGKTPADSNVSPVETEGA